MAPDSGRNTSEDNRASVPITAQPAGLAAATRTPQSDIKPEDKFEHEISTQSSPRKQELLNLLISRVNGSLQTEGIYRVSPSQELKRKTIDALCSQATEDRPFNIDIETQGLQNETVAILTACLLKVVCKTILAEAEMDALLEAYSAVYESEDEKILALRTTMANFPEDTQHLLVALITHLSQDVVSMAATNKMTAPNLGVVIGQNLFNFTNLDKSFANMGNANAAILFLIAHAIPNAVQRPEGDSIHSVESSVGSTSDSPPPLRRLFFRNALEAEQSTPIRATNAATTAVTPSRIQVTPYELSDATL
ncbi:MAG: Rho GTPase-activating protein [bacterium]|nr:Rho GTPase-activating protein [bacterium]